MKRFLLFPPLLLAMIYLLFLASFIITSKKVVKKDNVCVYCINNGYPYLPKEFIDTIPYYNVQDFITEMNGWKIKCYELK